MSDPARAPALAGAAGWSWEILDGGAFAVAAALAPPVPGADLVVYLEGDGADYAGPGLPAPDPTPDDPLALRLALLQGGMAETPPRSLAWLARPCQYVRGPRCGPGCWTTGRYGPEIVAALETSLDLLKVRRGARRLWLAGYSGGGALAVLLAARSADVAGLITVVANLDLAYWGARDGVPLSGSLDPAAVAHQVARLPQVHFTGGRDRAVGPDVVRAFLRRLPADAPARMILCPDCDHCGGWDRDWPGLLRQAGW
ncbi:alpha/beta hydrolase family protein [mine drainage metagenome]|uniref:Alpha/beta hydrolase family protein n=1 Tax=mine drainage metagenome TaxID=410659 RepID=A0A1J5R3A2_9ZZZZ